MKLLERIALGAFFVTALAAAATLDGTVRSRTTGRPAAGDQVVVLSVASNGMTEAGRGATDALGRFRIPVPDTQSDHLVRVVHQGANYQAKVSPGVLSVEVSVYDVSRTLDQVIATSDAQWLEAEGDTLKVVEEITVRNASKPPRVLLNDRPFEIQLPPGAEIAGGKVQAGGGRPITFKPSPTGQPGRYSYPLPLYPGDTRFVVAYQVPYRGAAEIDPKSSYPLERLVVTLPDSIKFESRIPGLFQSRPGKGSSKVYEAAANAGRSVAFRISGSGSLAKHPVGQAVPLAQGRPNGAPVPAPRKSAPRAEYRWFLPAALALVLASGAAGLLAHKRKQPRTHRGSAAAAPAALSR